MRIRILFFAQLRDALRTEESSVEANEGATVGEVVRSVLRDPRLDRFKELPMRFAVNEHFEELNRTLHDQDTLAFLPPVAGG